ncbi:aromatic ring-hydroxylating dioxygenase subunit alpha [Oceanicella sp. SM1341]|uniref:aromatic ring-hydroxylating oxygenase subunit alpha n=1 Tax=Oceanicella sp. SM1341 TaxID=1548889 RepID=UPI000E4F29BD|nr:aromatic ring-hydroxylating dioxygenase subunit alpha [Oceanicella sp. SM1341]
MQGTKADLMRGLWYVAAPGRAVKPGKMLAKTLLGEPVLICRKSDGGVFALRDACPHRGIPLRYGSFDGTTVQCCYHGWRFGEGGVCTEIPSLAPGQRMDIAKINTGDYPCVEQQGVIWMFFGEKGEKPSAPPPRFPHFDKAPDEYVSMPFDCSADHAAFGLMDPTHAAFVHTSWWFKKDATTLKAKEKHFAPSELGWSMVRHQVPGRNVAYRPLGREVETQISYMLPGLRIEEIAGEKHQVVSVTAITPLTDSTTEVIQLIWWSMPWMTPFKPLLRHLARVFIDQDRAVVQKQKEGLEHNPRLMLIPDADTQAKWWMRMKDEWVAHRRDDREFRNPIRETVLRWRS